MILYLQSFPKYSFSEAIAQLKELELRLLDTGTEQQASSSALSAAQKPKGKHRGPPEGFKVGECYQCQFIHHKQNKCPKLVYRNKA
jgi:hypothetical protein